MNALTFVRDDLDGRDDVRDARETFLGEPPRRSRDTWAEAVLARASILSANIRYWMAEHIRGTGDGSLIAPPPERINGTSGKT